MNPYNPFRPNKIVPRSQDAPPPITGAMVNAFRRAAFPFSPRPAPAPPSPPSPPPAEPSSPSAVEQETSVRQVRRFASGMPTSPMSSAPEKDDVFRRRVAIQRASRVWSPLLAAWYRAPAAMHGSWTLRDLMREVRDAARTLVGAGNNASEPDQQTMLTFQGLIANGIAAELSWRAGRAEPLPASIVRDIAADLAALRDEPPATSLREAPAETVLTQGRSSLSLTLMDAAVRLLPALARHAGLATKATLDSILLWIMDRAEAMANDVLGDAADLSAKARQSLVQSFLRRETDLLMAALETLPTAGPGALARGQAPLEEALDLWRSWSAMAAQSVLEQLEQDEPSADPSPAAPRPAGP